MTRIALFILALMGLSAFLYVATELPEPELTAQMLPLIEFSPNEFSKVTVTVTPGQESLPSNVVGIRLGGQVYSSYDHAGSFYQIMSAEKKTFVIYESPWGRHAVDLEWKDWFGQSHFITLSTAYDHVEDGDHAWMYTPRWAADYVSN